VQDGRIVADAPGARTIDAAGMVVMPGGVDMHSHIAGPKVNLARKMRPEESSQRRHARHLDHALGTGGSVPSIFTTGYRYAMMGYTTAFDASRGAAGRSSTSTKRSTTSRLSTRAFRACWATTSHHAAHRRQAHEQARDYVAWLLQATKAYAIQAGEPGGVELWKFRGNVHTLDDEVTGLGSRRATSSRRCPDVSAELKPAPHGAHPLQQSGYCRELGKDPGDDEGAGRRRAPYHAHPISQLRRHARLAAYLQNS